MSKILLEFVRFLLSLPINRRLVVRAGQPTTVVDRSVVDRTEHD